MSGAKKYVHAATSLQLASWRHFLGFLRASRKVQFRLRHISGVVKFKLRAKLLRRTFETYSIYEDQESLQDLVYSAEHVEAMKKMAEWSGPESRTTNWTSVSSEIDWEEARSRLAEAPSYRERQARAKAGVQIKI